MSSLQWAYLKAGRETFIVHEASRLLSQTNITLQANLQQGDRPRPTLDQSYGVSRDQTCPILMLVPNEEVEKAVGKETSSLHFNIGRKFQ